MLIAGNLMASCGNDSGKTNDTTDAQTGTESESIEESTGPSFPEIDMEGKKFTIFAEGWASFDPLSINDIMAEELTGDSLNDAIYNRNVKVEKQYNCKVSFLEVGDTIAAHNQLKQSVMAADQSYDIAIIRTYNYLSAITTDLSWISPTYRIPTTHSRGGIRILSTRCPSAARLTLYAVTSR